MRSFSVSIFVALFFAAIVFAIPYSSLNGLDIDNGEKPIIESIDLFSENPIFSRFEYELPPLEKYQCLFHILGNLSYAYRLATIWDAIKNDLNNHMDAWKKCPDASNHIDYENCVLKEGFAVVLLHRNYLVTLKSHEKGPEIIKEYEKLSKEKCFGNKMIEYECQFEALAKVSEDNGLSKEWANIKYDVEHHIEAFKKCRELYPKSERLYKRCVFDHGIAVALLHHDYLQLIQEHPSGTKIMEEYQKILNETCYG